MREYWSTGGRGREYKREYKREYRGEGVQEYMREHRRVAHGENAFIISYAC